MYKRYTKLIFGLVFALVFALALLIIISAVYFNYAKDYGNDKKYIGRSAEECSRIQYLCAPGHEQFSDDKGCGCVYTGRNLAEENVSEKRNFCPDESRKGDFCVQVYKPVCGWFYMGSSKTFGNSCFACLDKGVDYWIEGECLVS